MARGQITRLTTRAVAASESALDYFDAAVRNDNVIDLDEQRELRRRLKDGYDISQAADEAFGIGVSILRGGVTSGWAKRQGFTPDLDAA